MTGWVAPAATATFWLGLLIWPALSGRLPAAAAFAIGAAALGAAWIAAPRRIVGDSSVLVRAGLARKSPSPVSAVAGPRGDPRRVRWPAAALALVGVLALGVGWAGLREARVNGSLFARLPPGRLVVEGTLRADPEPSPFGWSAILDARIVQWPGGAATVHEPVWIDGSGDVPRAVRGDLMRLEGSARP